MMHLLCHNRRVQHCGRQIHHLTSKYRNSVKEKAPSVGSSKSYIPWPRNAECNVYKVNHSCCLHQLGNWMSIWISWFPRNWTYSMESAFPRKWCSGGNMDFPRISNFFSKIWILKNQDDFPESWYFQESRHCSRNCDFSKNLDDRS